MNILSSLIFNIREHLNRYDNLEDYKLSADDIIKIKNFNYKNLPIISGKYSKKRVHLEDNFEITYIVWDKDSETGLHNHPKNGCIMYLIEGDLVEKRVTDIMELYIRVKSGNTSYIDDNQGKHKITAKKISYSFHIYSPPKFYD
tara:strand:+ start:451 stop:882 length:432 start_codon:yes stop_codon:yes gene_type:complete